MYYGRINNCDIANGPGVRVTLFVSGCRRHCPGCFQPETWDFRYGKLFGEEAVSVVMEALGASFIRGLTILGGEPMEPENARELLAFVREVRRRYPEKDIWCFTGRLWEELTGEARVLAESVDVLVDGPFVEAEKKLTLRFRGSENQRIIDVTATLRDGLVRIWEE